MNVFISAASGAVPTKPPITRPPRTLSRSSIAAAASASSTATPSATSRSTALRYRWKSMSTTRGTSGMSVGRTSAQSSNNVERSDSGTK